MVNYKKQVLIMNIKANIQFLICHIILKRKKFFDKVIKIIVLPVNKKTNSMPIRNIIKSTK